MIATGVLVNPFTVARLLTADGRIDSPEITGSIVLAQAVSIMVGLHLLRRPSAPGAGRRVPLLTALLLLSILVTELAMRPLRPIWPEPVTRRPVQENRVSSNLVADPLLGWRLVPSSTFELTVDGSTASYHSDSSGFRVRAGGEKQGRLVALLGDSFAFGFGVAYEESFAGLLEERLEGVRVRNLALPGFGTDQMWLTTRHVAIPDSPAVVVVAFIDADLERNLHAHLRAVGFNKPALMVRGGRLEPEPPDTTPSVVEWLERSSGAWNLARIAQRQASFRYPHGEWWQLATSIFAALDSEVRGSGCTLLVVRLPMQQRKEFPALARALRRLDVRYIDLGRPGVIPPGSHFATDMHLNAAGHALVADTLARALQALVATDGSE